MSEIVETFRGGERTAHHPDELWVAENLPPLEIEKEEIFAALATENPHTIWIRNGNGSHNIAKYFGLDPGVTIPREQVAALARLHYGNYGGSIYATDLGPSFTKIEAMRSRLSEQVGQELRSFMVMTPRAGVSSSVVHHDMDGTLVTQIRGEKKWEYYPDRQMPAFWERKDNINGWKMPEEVTLSAGQWMYVPGGLPHVARALEESIHVGFTSRVEDVLKRRLQFLPAVYRTQLPKYYVEGRERWLFAYDQTIQGYPNVQQQFSESPASFSLSGEAFWRAMNGIVTEQRVQPDDDKAQIQRAGSGLLELSMN